MADLTSSAVTLNRDWFAGLQRNVRQKDVTLVLTAQGTSTNKIPATALGLTKILGPTVLVKSDDLVIVLGTPDYAGDNLLLKNEAAATALDYTGTFRGVVTGI